VESKFLLDDDSNLVNHKINTNLKSYWGSKVILDTAETRKATIQERVENLINNYLANNIVTWNQRENVKGDFFVWIYKLRNSIFGIKAQTIRKMIPQKYEYNMEALKLTLADAINNNVKVILYILPIRKDVNLPYEKADYQKFKEYVMNLKSRNCTVLDFDDIIPGKLWGYKEATNFLEKREVDYMHFQFKGHQILADSLFQYIKE
jgi:lysophospholipase L1-like esterase